MKLIKNGNHYYSLMLINNKELLATTENVENVLKLSLKNCEAIENGYDLNELSWKFFPYHEWEYSNGSFGDINEENRETFKIGFQKALEILGDKKFSKYDMLDFAEFFMNLTDKSKPFQKLKDWESLQQTEFDVEVVTKPYTEVGEGFNLESKREPKLDAENCLILKRL